MDNNRSIFTTLVAIFSIILPIIGIQPVFASTDSVGERPKIGLVLSGGGARGIAHVGVLKALEEMHIPIDMIAGTSIGAIIGGLYASGMSSAEIERVVSNLDWEGVFHDKLDRQDRSFRRKTDDELYLIKAKPGFNNGEVQLPLSFIQGQKFDLVLNRLLLHVADIRDFDDLPIPFRAVATDLETGEEVVLGKGNLAQSVRASMAIPGAFRPVEIDGHLLVDGNVANNLPISVARDMGADIVIAVDISSKLLTRKELKSVINVLDQWTTFLTKKNVDRQLATLTKEDVYVDITEALGDIGVGSFERVAEAIPIGEQAAVSMREALQVLSVDTNLNWAGRKKQRATVGPVIDSIRIENQSRLHDDVVAARINISAGKPLDVAQLEKDIGQIYGLEIFESVSYEIIKNEADGKRELVIHARERSWGPNYLQFGLSFADNLDGENKFNLGVSYLRTAINKFNGELRILGQIGDEPAIGAEIYQPLGPESRWFAAVNGLLIREDYNVFDDGHLVADYQIDRARLRLSLGREFGTWGEVRLGYLMASGDANVRIANSGFSDFDFDQGEIFLRLAVDERDDAFFPRQGYRGFLEGRSSRKSLGADDDFEQIRLAYSHFNSFGKNTLFAGINIETTLDNDAPVQSLFRLGGFPSLPGFAHDELSGQHAMAMTGGYYRQFMKSKLFSLYAGGTLGVGNVWQDKDDISFNSALWGGSLFLGADTPIGPVYTGYGVTEGGHDSLFLFLGQPF